ALDALPPLPCRASPVSPVARRPTRAERPGPSPLVPKCTSPDGERRSADNRTDVPTGRLSRAGRITSAARGGPQCPDDLVSTDLEPSPAISARGGGDSLLRVEPRSRLASTLEVPAIVGGPSKTRTLDPLIKSVIKSYFGRGNIGHHRAESAAITALIGCAGSVRARCAKQLPWNVDRARAVNSPPCCRRI